MTKNSIHVKEVLAGMKALSDETRIRIVNVLSNGAFHVNEIVQILNMGQSRVSRHLKILLDAGILESQREGSLVYYRHANIQKASFTQELTSLLLKHSNGFSYKVQDDQKVKEILNSRREKSKIFFDKLATSITEIQEQVLNPEIYKPYLLSLLPKKINLLVDLGCGAGVLINDYLHRAKKVIGIDASSQMLEVARKNFANNKKIDLIQANVENLPFIKNQVDVVVASMVLHHISNPALVFLEASKILKTNGLLCIVDLLKHEQEFMREKYADLWLGFDPQILQNWLLQAGFKIEDYHEIQTKMQFKIITIKAKKQGEQNVNTTKRRL
jgi:ArsR family transcriptional regulator